MRFSLVCITATSPEATAEQSIMPPKILIKRTSTFSSDSTK
ncbi:hypothetical protein CP061683_1219, partial [Chlamydia psittaci 06-1683]